MAKNLKSFCDSHNFDFPDFTVEEFQGAFITHIKWYNEYITNSGYHTTMEGSAKSSICNLSLWTSSDVNFIWLVNRHQSSLMKF